jgi:hypothetical protein
MDMQDEDSPYIARKDLLELRAYINGEWVHTEEKLVVGFIVA